MTSVPKFTARTKARKRAADILFEAQIRGHTSSPRKLRELLDERKSLSAAQTPLPRYSAQIVEGVAERLSQIDGYIAARQRRGGIDRLPAADLAIMRVAVWEMMDNPDVDPVVAIDEAVAITKAISTDESPAFVNAVLDRIREDLAQGVVVEPETKALNHADVSPEEMSFLDELLDEY